MGMELNDSIPTLEENVVQQQERNVEDIPERIPRKVGRLRGSKGTKGKWNHRD